MARWREALKGEFTRLIGSAARVSAFSLAVYIFGAARHVTSAGVLGASKWMDAAVLSLSMSAFLINVLTGGVLSAFLPSFVRVREKYGRAAAVRLLESTAIATLGATAVVTLSLLLLRTALVDLLAPRFDEAQVRLAAKFLLVLVPCSMMSGLSAVYKAALNAEGRFALAASVPGFVPASAVAAMLVLSSRIGVDSLVVGVAVGYLLELVALGVAVRSLGFRALPRRFARSVELSRIGRQVAVLVVGSFVVSTAPLVDTIMATSTADGGTSLLDYANKAIQFPLGIVVTGLTTTFFPVYSALSVKSDWAALRALRGRTNLLILCLSVPAAILLWVCSEPIVRVLFQRGAFSARDASETAAMFRMYALQLPFYALGMLSVRLLSALDANQFILYAGILSTLGNVVLNVLLLPVLGLPGIALSTSLSAVATFAFLEGAVVTRLQRLASGSRQLEG